VTVISEVGKLRYKAKLAKQRKLEVQHRRRERKPRRVESLRTEASA
jgi:hypothetical protein